MSCGTLHSAWMHCDPPYPADRAPSNLLANLSTDIRRRRHGRRIEPACRFLLAREKLEGLVIEATYAAATGMNHVICEEVTSSWRRSGLPGRGYFACVAVNGEQAETEKFSTYQCSLGL
jgi:hypothetical protein